MTRGQARYASDTEVRIFFGGYYATEFTLVRDLQTGRYKSAATPLTGTDRLFDFYHSVLAGAMAAKRVDHAVFWEVLRLTSAPEPVP